MALIAVDVTPMKPGGENGGVKILTLELLKSFQKASEHKFIVLTASWNHDELSVIDSPNMSRFCILNREKSSSESITEHVPGRIERVIRKVYGFLKRRFSHYKPVFLSGNRPLTSRGVDVLFCPFTAPTYSEPGIPVVSVIHDLQHKDYPQFFTSHEIDVRNAFMDDLCMKAAKVICISENVRQSVIKHLNISTGITCTIHNCIQLRLMSSDSKQADINNLGIGRRPYMFYPANFWPHKNHRMLVTAFNMFLSRNPDKKMDLVFTGALDDSEKELKYAVKQMGLTDNVHFLGFLDQKQFEAVWQKCRFLIFPSLYEGFGIPVLEAMSLGKPVLCSNTTSLPEVAGDAALYFDPRRPLDMVQCMEKIVNNSSLENELVEKGKKRAASFVPDEMTQKYLDVFSYVIKSPAQINNTVSGIFEDRWTGEEVIITYGADTKERNLEVRFSAPAHIPFKKVILQLLSRGKILQKITILRGEKITVQQALEKQKGSIVFLITACFRPIEFNMGTDSRNLGVICDECAIISDGREKFFLLKGHHNS